MEDIFYFIINPCAGSGKTMHYWMPAEKKLSRLGIRYETAMTTRSKHAVQLAYEAAAKGYRKIFSVGGDGSLHEVFNGICQWCFGSDTPLQDFFIGVAPIGSGNDWIKSFNIPNDIDGFVDFLVRGKYAEMDATRVVTGKGKVVYMANGGGIGFDSHVVHLVNQQKEAGHRSKLIYLNALRQVIVSLKPFSARVVVDDRVVYSGQIYHAAWGNGRYSGSGMRQVPLAVVDDGLLDIMILPKTSPLRIFREVPRLYTGTVMESQYIISARGKTIRIEPLDNMSADYFELDGEVEGRLPITIENLGIQINALKGGA